MLWRPALNHSLQRHNRCGTIGCCRSVIAAGTAFSGGPPHKMYVKNSLRRVLLRESHLSVKHLFLTELTESKPSSS